MITRSLLLVSIIFLTTTLSAQSSNEPDRQILYLTKSNGDTIQITGQFLNNSTDTALITISYLRNEKLKRFQKFKTLASFPIDISITSFDNKKGILITYDPAVRNGNSFLYLFDETKNLFIEVKGFRELGMTSPVNGSRKFFCSYISCGCADDCWISKLFTISQYKIQVLAKLSCDCNKLITTSKKDTLPTSCDEFNNKKKFDNIATYWKNTLKRGL